MTYHNYGLNNFDHAGTQYPSDFSLADWRNRDGLILTSNGAVEQQIEWRCDTRLSSVFRFIIEVAPNTAHKIGRLHDHKGLLSIYWLVAPNFKDRRLCEIVWGSSIAREVEENVEHLLYKAVVI